MATCPSCGGIIGRDCFNPQECAWITQQMNHQVAVEDKHQSFHEGYQQGYHEGYQAALNELALQEIERQKEKDPTELPF